MSGTKRTFSVVIPMYNSAATIVECLNSVFAQSFPPLEVIVVNDGSGDGSGKIIADQFNQRVRLIELPQNAGPSKARNVGMDAALGTHIALLDADDRWHCDKLKCINQAFDQQPDADLVFHDFSLNLLDDVDSIPRLHPLSFKRLLVSNKIATPCAVLNATTALRFEESMHYTEDYDLFLRTAYAGYIYHLPLVLTKLGRPILSTGGQSSNRWKMRKGEILAYLRLGKLNVFFLPILPVLIGWSLIKHLRKLRG